MRVKKLKTFIIKMDKTNRLLTLRINYLRRQINLKNFIILLITIYLAYRYFTSPPIDNSLREVDEESCLDICGNKWGECLTSCHNRELKCSYYYDDDEYGDIECGTKNNILSYGSCSKLCSISLYNCRDRCRAKYNIYSSIKITPNIHSNIIYYY
jgi:hypothetical protein